MAALTVWVFDLDLVDPVVERATTFRERGWIEVFDAALVRWEPGQDRPRIEVLDDLAGETPFGTPFWTRLFALTFFPADLGVGVGAAGATVADEDLGITPQLAAALRQAVQPGAAALFIYSSGELAATGAHAEEIIRARRGVPIKLLTSNLTAEQHQRLQGVFSTPAPPG